MKRVLCSWGCRSMVKLFLLQKIHFHVLNQIHEISAICTCNKDTGGTRARSQEKLLGFSVSCLEFTAVNYHIFIYLETSISRSDLTFFLLLFFSFENIERSSLCSYMTTVVLVWGAGEGPGDRRQVRIHRHIDLI